MKKNFIILGVFQFLFLTLGISQISKNDIAYWSGNGPDSVVFVVDFNEQGTNSSYTWGFLFDENSNITIQNMIDSFIANGMNVTANMNGGFLNDFSFLSHEGIGGTNSYYWATYSGNSFTNLTMNSGIQEILSNNLWIAFSFTDWNSESPYNPLQVIDIPQVYIQNASVKTNIKQDFILKSFENSWEIEAKFDKAVLFNINGKKISEWKNNSKLNINKEDLVNGEYFIQLYEKDKCQIIKILK